MLRTRIGITAALGFILLLGCALAAAHDLPAHTIMNSFVKIEPHQAHLVVRIPVDMLVGFSFPLKGDQYDLATAGPETQRALGVLGEGFILLENGVRLAPAESSGHLSPASDRSFQEYDTALAATTAPPDPTIGIANGMGFFDVHF